MEWILIVLLLSSDGTMTRREMERFSTEALCWEAEKWMPEVVDLEKYLESWCEHESQRQEELMEDSA